MTPTTRTIKLDIECRACKGTGLYMGFAEKNGSAVICLECRGTGCEKFKLEYTPFLKRRLRKDVMRVFKNSFGFGHSAANVTLPNGTEIHFEKGGVTYRNWVSGEQPKPVKDLYCPYMWTDQGLQHKTHPQHKLYKERCDEGLKLGMMIPNCKHFCDKAKCWSVFEDLGGS